MTAKTAKRVSGIGAALERRRAHRGETEAEAGEEINRILAEVLEWPDLTHSLYGWRSWTKPRSPGEPPGVDAVKLPAIAIYLAWTLDEVFAVWWEDVAASRGRTSDELRQLTDEHAGLTGTDVRVAAFDRQREIRSMRAKLEQITDLVEVMENQIDRISAQRVPQRKPGPHQS